MKSVRWPTRLADAGALACAGALFVAIALELPARAESRPPEAATAATVAAHVAPAPARTSAPSSATDVARAGG